MQIYPIPHKKSIRRFLETMIEHADTAIQKQSKVPLKLRPQFMRNNLTYWRHVKAGYKLALNRLDPKPRGAGRGKRKSI